jgi:homotetrameric cytidine deaminase
MTGRTEDLMKVAAEAAAKAYSIYSKRSFGAAIRTERNNVYSACNVENASYGLTMCAERAAVFAAVAAEGPSMRVTALALASPDSAVSSPCGACRQVLHEFGPSAEVITSSGETTTVATLLPDAFTLG